MPMAAVFIRSLGPFSRRSIRYLLDQGMQIKIGILTRSIWYGSCRAQSISRAGWPLGGRGIGTGSADKDPPGRKTVMGYLTNETLSLPCKSASIAGVRTPRHDPMSSLSWPRWAGAVLVLLVLVLARQPVWSPFLRART